MFSQLRSAFASSHPRPPAVRFIPFKLGWKHGAGLPRPIFHRTGDTNQQPVKVRESVVVEAGRGRRKASGNSKPNTQQKTSRLYQPMDYTTMVACAWLMKKWTPSRVEEVVAINSETSKKYRQQTTLLCICTKCLICAMWVYQDDLGPHP